MNIEIKQATATDYPAIYELNVQAFETDAEAKLVELLRKDKAFIPELSLIACIDNQMIGHILFTHLQIIDPQYQKVYESLALAPMAVHADYRNKGIGRLLIESGKQKAKDLGFKSIFVLGHADYYPKFGFEPASKWHIQCPYDVPDNYFMGIALKTDALKDISGMVQYATPFNAL